MPINRGERPLLRTLKHAWLLALLPLFAGPPTSAYAASEDPQLDAAAVRSGFQLYRQGAWSEVRVRLTNPAGESHAPLASVRLEPRDNVEFARRLWMPPRSRGEGLVPVFPFVAEPGANALEAPTRLIFDASRRTRATPWAPSLLPLRHEPMAAVHLGDWDDRDARRGVVRALRSVRGLEAGVLLTQGEDVPRQPISWQVADVLVISAERPKLDAMQRESLRRWLVRGGRLWVMLERVDPSWMSELLGDSWDIAVTDRLGLHDFEIEDADGRVRQRVESEFGVEAVRAFAPERMEVVHRVDGYPVSMRRDVGQGKVLVTTLGPEAWIDGDQEPLPALEDLAPFFDRPAIAPPERREAVTAAFEPFVRDQIGYEILGRGWVAGVLGGFVLALLGVGLALAWRGRLELIGVSGASVALLTTAGLIGLGMTHHRSQPLTVAAGKLIHTHPEQPYVHTIGATGVYVPSAHGNDRMTITGRHGVYWPADVEAMGTLTRLEWTDRDQWRFPRRALPPGAVHGFAGEGTQPVDAPTRAVVRLEEQRIAGEILSSPFGPLEDAVIATRRGQLATRFDSEGTRFAASPDALDRRQFVAGATLSERQNRRQEVYRALADGDVIPEQPVLLGWVDDAPLSTLALEANEDRQVHGLVMTPLEIEPPEPGTSVTIPSALMAKRGAGPELEQRYRPAGIYDRRDQSWVAPITQGSMLVMRFDPPSGLGPLAIQRATVRFNLHAPGWRYRVLAWRDGRIEPVDEGANPLGSQRERIELTDERVPQMTEDGGLYVGLSIERDDAGSGGWSLERLDLSVTGISDAEAEAR